MDFLIVLLLALLVGVSGAVYFRIFRLIYVQNGGKVIASEFTRTDGYLALGCLTLFALQCVQSLQGKGRALPATIDTGLLVVVQLGFWLFVIGTILISLLLRRMRPAELFGFDRLGFTKVFLWGAGLLLSALPLIFASSAVVSSLMHVNSQKDSQPIMQLFERAGEPAKRIPIIILAIVIAPLAEEFFFRGFLYGVLKRYAGALPALVFTGVAFALIHLHVPSLLPLFLLACVLTLAYELSGSLLVPMAMHALFNAITLVGVFFTSR
ncbi:MAG TPA: type II CAAX endopeptidase family protein [Chthoniobacterales bacterium]|jgi:membrane protease YdiL (CAAX protease family)|nr:type II CAAX endopeptidase family protein [Chthoniobacterales bacterium]